MLFGATKSASQQQCDTMTSGNINACFSSNGEEVCSKIRLTYPGAHREQAHVSASSVVSLLP